MVLGGVLRARPQIGMEKPGARPAGNLSVARRFPKVGAVLQPSGRSEADHIHKPKGDPQQDQCLGQDKPAM